MSSAKFKWLGLGGFTCSEQFQAHGWSKQTHWYANEIGNDRLSQRELRCNNTSDATYWKIGDFIRAVSKEHMYYVSHLAGPA